jgi:hypothetical protein
MNKEKYVPGKTIEWAKHSRNSILGKQKFNKLRRRSVRKMILKNK